MNDKTKIFIQKAKTVHGELYDYKKVIYTKAIDKITIICAEHGEYSQAASEHLKGRGCSSCGYQRVSTADFISKSKEIHGDRYDYSKSHFVKSILKTTVTCKLHGDFQISPNNHQRGKGCVTCSKIKRKNTVTTFARNQFKEKAMAIHGDMIDFSKVKYVTAKTKTIFICPAHGEWEAIPDNILSGKGCPNCRAQKIIEANHEKSLLAAKTFVARASKIHQDKYDYSKSEYRGSHVHVEIMCPDHGVFWQSPGNHLSQGNGCPDCSIFGYRTSKPGWLYLQTLDDEFIKVGITNHTPERRMKEQSRNSKLRHIIVAKWYFEDGNIPLLIETQIKREFECGVVLSDIMKDGHSETMHIKELPSVLELIRLLLKIY